MPSVNYLEYPFSQSLSIVSGNTWCEESKINKWDESRVTDSTSGIKREDVPQFLEMLKESMDFPSPNLSAEFGRILQQMTDGCNHKGLTSTIYGNLDQKTALYGLFHCSRNESEDTLSVSYTIHTLSTEFERRNVVPGLRTERGFKEEVQLGRETTENYLATSAAKELADMGIDIPLNMESGEAYICSAYINIGQTVKH